MTYVILISFNNLRSEVVFFKKTIVSIPDTCGETIQIPLWSPIFPGTPRQYVRVMIPS